MKDRLLSYGKILAWALVGSSLPAINKEQCVSCFLVSRAAHQRAKSHETHTSGGKGEGRRDLAAGQGSRAARGVFSWAGCWESAHFPPGFNFVADLLSILRTKSLKYFLPC